ncbi:choice-of-anchor D domain-containing protein [Marivirga sp. S37H4]|uniref:Choice-of-anchor D domain-containing protein n=1 Tax=Marivirga aurantiaca TaxID=2802615 RepID=A0A935C943_9BACT|nr:choice-of-anchor D domain-containing protein [Marivirga aurantiaca]MBK6265961.1 choice-of-anchor D domain-containing protein [Marivirga aurantiaca]
MKKNYPETGFYYFLSNIVGNKGLFLTSVLWLLFSAVTPQVLLAQKAEKRPAVPVICPAKQQDMFTKVNIPKESKDEHQRMLQNEATAEFDVTFGPGAQANPEASAAFEYALDIWATQIVSPVPIKVYADFANLGPGVLASAGPAYNVTNFPGAPEEDVLYPAALANALAGEVLFPDEEYDLIVNLGDGIPWYFGLDGNTPSGLYDFVTVALHEAGHGLGFTTVRGYNNGTGTMRSNGQPSIFGIFMEDGDGDRLLDFPDPSTELGDAFTGGDLYMGGEYAVAALGGERPELYAPSTWQGGSSIAHWDEAAFPAGDVNSLMTPQVGSAESNFDIGDITRGLFKDMGWVINDEGAPTLVATPTSISDEILIGEAVTHTISLSNISDTIANVSLSSSSGTTTIIEFFDPEELMIEPGETDSFTVGLNAAELEKGIYEDTILVVSAETSDTLNIPVYVQVLDGTEAPEISVSPDSLAVTLEQMQTGIEELTISNTGDADLTFSIEVNDDSTTTFPENVIASNNYIRTEGFIEEQFPFAEGGSKSALIRTESNTFNRAVTSLYATDFEDFPLGDINDQQGWISQYDDNWIISDANPEEGDQHFRGVSDGLGGTRPGNILALSPTITPLDEPFMTMTASVNIEGSGVTWEVIPQSPTEGSVVTRVRFNPDGTVDVLADPDFVRIDATTPEGYFDLKIAVDKDDATFSVYFDEELVFTGQGYASIIEQAVFLSAMEEEGSTFDVDNLEITDGDPDAFFVTVSPNSGTVPFGSSTTVDVRFDARALSAGEYHASLLISSNDAENSPIEVPVTLTVVQPPTIEVSPDSLSAAVNVQTDDPPTQTETFTISNTGESTLEFNASTGATEFTPFANDTSGIIAYESLDMSVYGVGNTGSYEEKLANAPKRLAATKSESGQPYSSTYTDSIAYDTGLDFPDDFAGVQTAAYTSALNFDVESDFTLTAVRNGYRTEAVANPVVVLEIYRGGATPNDGELLHTQTFEQASEEGIVVAEVLSQSLSFSAGESFWVVHKYPDGIAFPQGVDANATQRPNTYMFSSDGGASYNPSGFVFFVRALSGGGSEDYISLSPSSGSVSPGESVEVSVTFDGAGLANGMYDTDILINSNDPVTPTATVATHFEVTGQVSEISISDEYLLFNDVFLGAERERTFTISNEGLATLNVTDISSDNSDFTVSTSSATIEAGDSLVVTVNFAPSEQGNINGIITIESDAANDTELQVVVNGVGVEPPIARFDPQEVSETTEAGTTVETEITLVNDGNAPLIYSFPDLAVMSALSNPDVQLNNTEILSFSNASAVEEKGAEDNRVGSEVLYSVGTDNEFGYSWIDSDEPDGPVYAFNDITASGTEITNTLSGDGSAEIEMPFSFEFYGESYTNAIINANGFVAFQEPTASNTWTNSQIPVDNAVNNMIAGFWNDLEPQNFNGSVHYADLGDQFVVQWTNASLYSGTADETVTFQIVLNQNGNIDVYYEDVESASFLNSATVGIENADGTDGAQVAFNTEYVEDGLALRFVKPDIAFTSFISNVSSMSGVVPAGGSKDITVTLDATDLNDGVYYDELRVSTNAPSDSGSTALFELTVIGFPEIEITPDSIQFDSLFVGLTSEASFLIENVGSKDLEITSISNGNTDFVLDETGPITLAPDQSRIVNVEFTPSSVGFIDDEVTIESNDDFGNETAMVYLSGFGIDPPVISLSPDSLSLVVYKGDSTVENISITNSGGSELNYSLTPPYFASAQAANQEGLQYERLEFEKILSKEALDTRVGPAFLNASGGPGTFGYTWVDNNSGGPAYDYIDIRETGELANVGGDGDEQVALPFTFNFFGNDEDSVTIGANGFLTFAPLSGSNFVNQQIPDPANPNLFIAPMWDDIEPQNGGGVYYEGNEDYFIVQYDSVPGFGFPPFIPVPEPVSFQVILFPDGTIKMQYQDVESSSMSTSSTVGLEGPQGLSGLQVIFNNEYLTDELAITFTPPVRGTVAPGETVEVPITFYSDGLDAGETYSGDITVSSNDPVNPELTIPVELEVLALPEIVSFTLINAELNEEIGELLEGEIINLDNYASNSFSVLANVSTEEVGSVVFDFNGEEGFQIENIAPYALAGDYDNGNSFNPVEFPKGINTITATPFTGANGTGKEGESLTVNFEVIDNQPDFCYAESVISYEPGSRKNGRSLPPSRSNPQMALGEPQENDNYNFVALGFGGSITLELGCEVMDHEGNDLLIVETSFRDNNRPCESYPEKAKIEASEDGENWVVLAEEICRDGEVDLADGGLTKASFIRITDISNPDDFAAGNADGYDLDGIMVINNFADSTQTEMVHQVVDQVNIVANEESVEIMAYPNPVKDYVQFDLKGEGDEFHSKLYNVRGELIDHSRFSLESGEDKGRIDMRNLSQGLYHLRLTNAEGGIVSQMKILKN